MQKDNVTRAIKGISTDTSFLDQPKDTYRFALNAVDETAEGDTLKISTEQGDLHVTDITEGYEIVGTINMTKERIVIFSKDSMDRCEIGILDAELEYTAIVNDTYSTDKFDFSDNVTGIFRLRRGCEDTIYFVDGRSVRYFNFNKVQNFKDSRNVWDISKFNLQRTYSKQPMFEKISVVEGGVLPPGSYSALIQYLDEDLNPTEWIVSTDTIIIYKDRYNKDFEDIEGSTSIANKDGYAVLTNKAIEFSMNNLDTSFPYYRISMVEANSGNGEISKVSVSTEIPTTIKRYIFTGESTQSIPYAEVQAFDNIIESAEHIESVDNMLLLANTKGKHINFCEMQKYASKISADCVSRSVQLNDLSSDSNPKRGTVHIERTGYMPGEIYSFGIVYVFKDGTKSPVFHIPGKNHKTANKPFIPGAIPMSINNQLDSYTYTENDSKCIEDGGWATDSEGDPLNDSVKVRHHRFPTRQEANIGFVRLTDTSTGEADVRTLKFSTNKASGEFSSAENSLKFKITYKVDGVSQTKEIYDTVSNFVASNNTATYDLDILVNQKVDGEVGGGASVNPSAYTVVVTEISSSGEEKETLVTFDNLLYLERGGTEKLASQQWSSNIMGVAFSNIERPVLGEEVVGYYIVRNKRDELSKTVMDTGVLLPLVEDTNYTAFGQLFPLEVSGGISGGGTLDAKIKAWLTKISRTVKFKTSKFKKDAFALIHPEFLFNRREYHTVDYDWIGNYTSASGEVYMDHQITQDVMAGTSYDSSRNRKREKDSDGFSLHTLTRYLPVKFTTFWKESLGTVKDTFYLDVLYGKTIQDHENKSKEIYNLSADNRIGIVHFDTAKNVGGSLFSNSSFPYVAMNRKLSNPYGDFRVLPYYLEHHNMKSFDSITSPIFSGDSYISPVSFTSSSFYQVKIRKRRSKKSWGKFLIAGLLAVAAVAVNVIPIGGQLLSATLGTAAVGALTATAVSLAISSASSGFKQAQANKVYNELYYQGLKDCVDDDVTKEVFERHNPEDDEVQWLADTISNLWFESQVNTNWRLGTDNMSTDFINSPTKYNESQVSEYLINKLTQFDEENSEGKLYQGFANAELYDTNPDYTRRNWAKVFFHLGIEYDCCSDCQETFPHRVVYSQQSFQEELTDNYRKFLPNNYRDLDGETGVITNMFTLGNNLYLHTEDAIWLSPRNYQERVTDQIVSFLGTGDFLSVPPQKIEDSSFGISAGLFDKTSAHKNPSGYFYICEKELKIYQFDGKTTKAISSNGMNSDFKKLLSKQGKFISGYDPVLNRVLFTLVGQGGWTLSYSLNYSAWRSYHTYIPGHYLTTKHKLMSWDTSSPRIHLHNVGKFNHYRGEFQKHILEYVSLSNSLTERQWNHIRFDTTSKQLFKGEDAQVLLEVKDKTFNKAVLYNNFQCTGELTLDISTDDYDYLGDRVLNYNTNNIILDRYNNSWYFNDFKDYRKSLTSPIWRDFPGGLYTKELVPESIDLNKDWFDLEPMTGKFLVVRLIKDTEEDLKISTDFNIENELPIN